MATTRYNLNNSYKAVVIGGSAGSFQGIIKILSQLPTDFPLPIIAVLHRLKHIRNGFAEVLSMKTRLAIVEPEDKEFIKKGTVYLAPANYHLSVENGNYFSLSTEEMIHNSRPSIDVTLTSAAFAYRTRLIGILLSGANKDGGLGMKAIKERGGLTIVQQPSECMIDTMPKAALAYTTIDHTLNLQEITGLLNELQNYYK